MDLTLVALWIHVPVVTLWIGLVMFDVFAAAAPGLETDQRARMITWSRPLVVLFIILILLTGVRQTVNHPIGTVPEVRGWNTLQQLKDTTYGLALFWKHGAVLATFALTLAVRFVLAPRLRAGVSTTGSAAVAAEASGLRLVLWLSVLNLAACIAALLATTRMVWELH